MRTRAMNLYVTVRTTRVLGILVMSWTSRFICSDTVVHAVTRQTELVDLCVSQQSRIRGAMRRVTRWATVSLKWCVFVGEWSLLVSVAFYASGICARC